MTRALLQASAVHTFRNTAKARGVVVVFPGRGESTELYERLGDRLSYDGYDVVVAQLPAIDEIDGEWLDHVVAPDVVGQSAADEARITLVGSDSGAVIAALLASRWGVDALVLGGIGGIDHVSDHQTDDERIAARTSCPVHRGRLAAGADLGAVGEQTFGFEVVRRLQDVSLDIPTLAVHGADDAITPVEAAIDLYRAVAEDAEIVVVDGGVHDALNDVTHRTVSAELVKFLERKGGRSIIRAVAPATTDVAA
ncbi:alpha/beta fold hydrolase [Humibacter soli]